MGQKVHPTSFRIGTIYEWRSQWYADKGYSELLAEDIKLREFINTRMGDASISRIDIERSASLLTTTLHTAKPGIVIGRGGQHVDELRRDLERLNAQLIRQRKQLPAKAMRLKLDVEEIRVPELDSTLVARNVAEQLERRIAFRRAIKQAVQRTMQRGAEGAKIIISGRLGGAEMSRRAQEMQGRVPLHTLRADIDYGFAEAETVFGQIGVKVWIYKGEVLPFEAEPEDGASGPAQAMPPPATAPVPARDGGDGQRRNG